jgi:ABC-type phosphate/phosphonate transport system substrate-binding protein
MTPKLAHALLLVPFLILAGCSSSSKHPPKTAAKHQYAPIDSGSDDLIPVVAALHDQMHTWHGTPMNGAVPSKAASTVPASSGERSRTASICPWIA